MSDAQSKFYSVKFGGIIFNCFNHIVKLIRTGNEIKYHENRIAL